MNFKNIKLIVFDIDNTLIPNGEFHFRSQIKKMFIDLKKNNYQLALASGRDWISIGNLLNDQEIDFFIGANGSFAYDLLAKKYLYNAPIDFNDFKTLYFNVLSKDENNILNIALSDNNYVFSSNLNFMNSHWFWAPFKNKFKFLEIDNLLDFNSSFFHLITLNYDKLHGDLIIKKINDCIIENNLDLEIESYWESGLFITKKNINKLNAIKFLCDNLNINLNNVLAFGDGYNDTKMLNNVGFGVAMANANERTKNKAKMITKKTSNENGVLDFLKEHNIL